MNNVEIGALLVAVRGETSQRDLASQMRSLDHKWSHVTVGSVERGERPLRVTEALAAAEILEASPTRFLGITTDVDEMRAQLALANRRLRAVQKAMQS